MLDEPTGLKHPATGLSGEQLWALISPIKPERVASRAKPGGKGSISYVESYEIIARLISVFGFGNFDAEGYDGQIVKIEEFEEEQKNWSDGRPTGPKLDANGKVLTKTQYRVTAMASYRIRLHATGAVYSGQAASSQKGADLGEVLDFALKTAESDAAKRAARHLGTQFGLSLYASDDDHVHYADVVKVVLEPEQKAALDAVAADLRAQKDETAGSTTEAPNAAESATEAAAADALEKGFKHPEARKR